MPEVIGKKRILVVADKNEILFGSERVDLSGFEFLDSIVDALELISNLNFDVIALQTDFANCHLLEAVSAIKRIRPNCKIHLLTSINNEYATNRITKGNPCLLEAYHIYPFSKNYLIQTFFEPSSIMGDSNLFALSQKGYRERIRILEKLATEDDLTNAKNRRYLLSFLSQLFNKAKTQQVRITILLFDIDNFKQYNDTFGHSIGDKILRQVAFLMKKCSRKQDVIARIGGDEFVVLFWDCPEISADDNDDRRHENTDHPNEAIKVATRFVKEINSGSLPMLGPKGQGKLTISGGLASFPRDAKSIQELFDKADAALLEAKKQGKNQIYIVGSPENGKLL